MGGKTRASIALLGALAAAAAMLVVVPAFGSTHEDAVRLHLGTDAQHFTYELPDPDIVQPLDVGKKGCDLATGLNGPLVSLESTNGGSKVGLVDLGIGVKSGGSNANGTPCSQIDDDETLIINNTYDRLWSGLRLDLELKGNARTLVTLKLGGTAIETHVLLTGTSINGSGESPTAGFPYTATTSSNDLTAACASLSDSGPDSGGNDNCLWTIDSDSDFDQVEITTSIGTASLEGSEDFNDSPSHDTLFFLSANEAPVASADQYEVNEFSTASGTPSTLVVDAPGVLANDSDPNGPSEILSAVDLDTTGTLGNVSLQPDGSFSYTPMAGYSWAVNEFSYEDTFTYRAQDDGVPPLQSDPATVTITVYRVICSGDEVSASDVFVSGRFQRLSDSEVCKRYVLTASDADGEVIFEPEGTQTVFYRGFLTFPDEPGATSGGSATFSIGLQYDPDGPDGPDTYRALLACITPQFDGSGNVLAPGSGSTTQIPSGESWCIASFDGVATSAGAYAIEWQVVGESDPGFRAG